MRKSLSLFGRASANTASANTASATSGIGTEEPVPCFSHQRRRSSYPRNALDAPHERASQNSVVSLSLAKRQRKVLRAPFLYGLMGAFLVSTVGVGVIGGFLETKSTQVAKVKTDEPQGGVRTEADASSNPSATDAADKIRKVRSSFPKSHSTDSYSALRIAHSTILTPEAGMAIAIEDSRALFTLGEVGNGKVDTRPEKSLDPQFDSAPITYELPKHVDPRIAEMSASSFNAVDLRDAIERYRVAFTKMREKGTEDRDVSRLFCIRLAELSSYAWNTADATPTEAFVKADAYELIREIYRDQELFNLASSTVAAWMRWDNRKTTGVVVAGIVVGLEDAPSHRVVQVELADRPHSVVAVIVQNDDATQSLRVGDRAIFLAQIVPAEGEEDVARNSLLRVNGILIPRTGKNSLARD